MSSLYDVSAFDHSSANPKSSHFLQDNMPIRTFNHQSRTFSSCSSFHRVSDSDKNDKSESKGKDFGSDEDNDSLVDSMLWDSNVRLIMSGFARHDCTDDIVMFVNCGGEASFAVDCAIQIMGDTSFEGGDVLRTSESINDAGDYPYIYQSSRVGNFRYQFRELPPGSYSVDLHFSEIINTNGPKGMRVFNVFLQEEKVLSEFDVFSIVGANKPLQLVGMRVSLNEDGVMGIKFEGVNGNPIISGICIRKAANDFEHIKCANCAADIEVSSMQTKLMRTKASEKYEKKIKELAIECQYKAKECHEAWMSLTTANQQLEEVRMGLDNKIFQIISLDQIVGKQADNIRNMKRMYDHSKRYWKAMIIKLQEDVKIMKEEHFLLSREVHDCLASIPELSKMVLSIQAVVEQCEDFKVKYIEEQTKRKVLHNQIQETKGNIRVFCRCRPLNNDEVLAGCAIVADFDAAKDGDIGITLSSCLRKNFKFDRVYSPTDDQVDVFADALPLVTSFLDGYNVCIFAYGQTGTGKTFTMEGTELNRGVNYRTLEELFKIASERCETFTYNLSVSALEVYNEQIRDLLAASPTLKKLEIRQSSEGSLHVPGIVEAKVDTIKEVWNVLQVGSNARAIGSNNVNQHSSRSHCMLCVMVKAKNLMSGECTKSKLWLVDLAGSERLAKTDVQGERLKEAQNINRSLSALADVINALAMKGSHIPYR